MPAGPIIPKPVLTAVFSCNTVSGSFSNITYWVPATPPASLTVLVNWALAFETLFAPLYINVLESHSIGPRVDLNWDDGTHSFDAGDSSGAAVGAIGASPVSDQNAVVIRKYTGLTKPRNRGRWFIGGCPNTIFDVARPDELDVLTVAAYQALASAFAHTHSLAGVNFQPVHWNRTDNVLTNIAFCDVSSRIASRDDRRRRAPNVPL